MFEQWTDPHLSWMLQGTWVHWEQALRVSKVPSSLGYHHLHHQKAFLYHLISSGFVSKLTKELHGDLVLALQEFTYSL